LVFSINSIAAASFIMSGNVKWSAAIVMAIAAILGGYSGAKLARRFGRTFARRAVIAIGVIMTISLLFNR
ncbi:TSUP family transporter, partial [Salmonella enterica]|uniref:TSUP family transporter n=1 Tax=Salmonella enterica TaxID=28901 RepID=UPI0039E796AC